MAKFSPTKSDSVFISSANKCTATQSSWSRNARFSASFLPKKWLDIKWICHLCWHKYNVLCSHTSFLNFCFAANLLFGLVPDKSQFLCFTLSGIGTSNHQVELITSIYWTNHLSFSKLQKLQKHKARNKWIGHHVMGRVGYSPANDFACFFSTSTVEPLHNRHFGDRKKWPF